MRCAYALFGATVPAVSDNTAPHCSDGSGVAADTDCAPTSKTWWCRLACTSSRHAAPLVLGQVRVARGVDPWPSELTMKKMIGQVMSVLLTPPRRPPQPTRPHLQGGVLTDPTYHRG